MNIDIVNLPEMFVIGKELRTTWMNNECFSAIPAFWEKQRNENLFQQIPNKIYPDVILGLYTNYTPDFSLKSGYYSLIICSPVSNINDIPKGMVSKKVPSSKYALFTAKGPFYPSIANVWLEEIWKNKNLERSFMNDIEWYDSKSTNDENSVVKIYISIK